MKKLLLVLSTILLLYIAGCGTTVQTYTFEVQRTDQQLLGNRGFISGEPQKEEADLRKPTRTWVGVDIELPTRRDFIDETGITIFKNKK